MFPEQPHARRQVPSDTAGGVWWSTLGTNPPARIIGNRRLTSARMAASPRGIVSLSKCPMIRGRR